MVTFEDIIATDEEVSKILMTGGDLEHCVAYLIGEKKKLIELSERSKELVEEMSNVLQAIDPIVPRKIMLPNGTMMVHRCPDDLVPVIEFKIIGEENEESVPS